MLFLVGGNGGSLVRGVWGGEGLPSYLSVDLLRIFGYYCCCLYLLDYSPRFLVLVVSFFVGVGGTGGGRG